MSDLPLILSSLLRADLTVVVKNLRTVVLSVVMGLFLILVTRSQNNGHAYGGHAYVVGLATVFALITTGILGYAVSTARDRESGVLRRLQVTPAPGWAVIGSRMVTQAIPGLVLALAIVAIGAQIDALSPSAAQYGLVLAFSALGMAVFLSIGLALVGLIRSASTVDAASRTVWVVLTLIGLLGQGDAFHSAWGVIAPWTPVSAVMTLYAGVLGRTAWTTDGTESLLACATYIVVFTSLGIRFFRWEAR